MSNESYPRKRVLWTAMIPQIVLLGIAVLWIFLFPKFNIFDYLKFEFKFIVIGFFVGLALAFAGYGFYNFSKKTKKFYETVELFEELLSPAFKDLRLVDIVLLSCVSGFCEEIFFRGVLQKAFGIVLASVGFGLLHLPGLKFWIYALWATLSGVLFGILFNVSGSLWLPITAHITNNIVGMILLSKLKN